MPIMPLGEHEPIKQHETSGVLPADMFRSHTPIDTSGTSFGDQVNKRRKLKQSPTNPTHFTNLQKPGGNQIPRMEGETLQPVQNQFSEQKLIAIRQQEKQEQAIEDHALWWGGLFEAGGSMNYSINKQNRPNGLYVQARPAISFVDNDEKRVRTLQELFGGNIQKHDNENSWKWRLTGNQAIFLANAMQSFTPSHQEFMAVAQMWDDTTMEERVAAAQELRVDVGKRHQRIIDAAMYARLVQEPAFVAGVIDSRGFMGSDTINDHVYPFIRVYSMNRSLLEALKKTYGGKCTNYERSGEGFRWLTQGTTSQALYDLVKPHLLLRAEMAEQVFSQPPSRRGKEGKIEPLA